MKLLHAFVLHDFVTYDTHIQIYDIIMKQKKVAQFVNNPVVVAYTDITGLPIQTFSISFQ